MRHHVAFSASSRLFDLVVRPGWPRHDWHQDVEPALQWLFAVNVARIDYNDRSFEAGSKSGYVVVEFVAAGDGLLQADDQEVVAFLGFLSDCL